MTESLIFWRLRARLDDAKREAAKDVDRRAKLAANYPGTASAYLDSVAPVDWREIARAAAKRRYARPTVWNPSYTDERGREWRWLEKVDGSGLIVVVDNATERQSGNRTTGYYVDPWGHGDSQYGVVLGTRDADSEGSRRARYFPAISDPHNDGAYRVLWTSCDTVDDAASEADGLAEREAEREREYQAAWSAGSHWSDLGQEVRDARKQLLEILRDRKAASGSTTLCSVIREKVESLLESIRDARVKRERLADGDGASDRDYESTFWTGEKRLREAFNEGAGCVVLA